MRTRPASGELPGSCPAYLPEFWVARGCANQGETADEEATVTVEVIRSAAEAINEIQSALDCCVAP